MTSFQSYHQDLRQQVHDALELVAALEADIFQLEDTFTRISALASRLEAAAIGNQKNELPA